MKSESEKQKREVKVKKERGSEEPGKGEQLSCRIINNKVCCLFLKEYHQMCRKDWSLGIINGGQSKAAMPVKNLSPLPILSLDLLLMMMCSISSFGFCCVSKETDPELGNSRNMFIQI